MDPRRNAPATENPSEGPDRGSDPTAKARRSREAKALARWRDLNERQRAYLAASYGADQQEEAWQRSSWRRGFAPRPAKEWRWVLYGSPLVESSLQLALKAKGLVDKGTGSTFAALEDRGLLRTRHGLVSVVVGGRAVRAEVLYVRMATAGRSVARAGLGEEAPGRLPVGNLREWHWRALARAYAAGEAGLDREGGVNYGRIGWNTWLRLRDYKNKGGGYGGLVEERRVGWREPVLGYSSPEHRLFATPDGRRFYEERFEEYRRRYPEVEAEAQAPDRPPAGS